jgi:hypothetical protein
LSRSATPMCLSTTQQNTVTIAPLRHSRMFLAGIQKKYSVLDFSKVPCEKEQIIACFKAGEFEKAIAHAGKLGVSLSEGEVRSIIDCFSMGPEDALSIPDWIPDPIMTRRLRRRIDCFAAFCNDEFDPKSLIPRVDLPDDYNGKVLLVSIGGGVIPEVIALRSNDLYHRDILRNTQLEIADLGLSRTQVLELGGACISAQSDERIWIWGSSDEFGAGDKEVIAMLVRERYPEKTVVIEDR